MKPLTLKEYSENRFKHDSKLKEEYKGDIKTNYPLYIHKLFEDNHPLMKLYSEISELSNKANKVSIEVLSIIQRDADKSAKAFLNETTNL